LISCTVLLTVAEYDADLRRVSEVRVLVLGDMAL
jgi:hypothetical protein